MTYTDDTVELLTPEIIYGNGALLRWSKYGPLSNPPFVSYEVHRSTTAGFTPSASTLVATIRDVNATILHQLGIDHARLSVKHQGLDQRLTGVEAAFPIKAILA